MSVLDVWNQALSAAGAKGRLASITESSPEREVCEQWYDSVLEVVQTAAWWPSSRTVARLATLAEGTDTWADGQPEPGYAYAYAMPDAFLHPWHLTDYSRFSLSYSATLNRQILSSNSPGAALVYARRNEEDAQWTPDQRMATIYGLAAHITGPLTGRTSSINRNFQLANDLLEHARAQAANSMEPPPKAAVPWLAARGYSSASNSTRFYYPYGGLFNAGVVSAS